MYNQETMKLDEKTIDYLEQHIPELAEAATKQAYWNALASGNSVLVSEDGLLIENFPDGTSKIVGKSEPFVKVKKGKIKIKK
jgi:hypothetical protein